MAQSAPGLTRMADGTIKQVNPFTGTQVWSVPGRGDRPLVPPSATPPRPLEGREEHRVCSFCVERYDETTPELARIVRRGPHWLTQTGLSLPLVKAEYADFRVFGNLFEIVSYDYWVKVHGYQPSVQARARMATYLSTFAGHDHVARLAESVDGSDGARFFAGCHNVVVAKRHYVDGARTDDQLCGSGQLTKDEHEQYVALTIATMKRLYDENPHAVLVAGFQNWLRPAGASFDHLHKQLVAVDEFGTDMVDVLDKLKREPDMFVRWGIDYAEEQGLVLARNEYAVATAGVGHRFPAVEVWSTVPGRPWELPPEAVRGFSDLLHDMHVATGAEVPTNEEWHHQPPSVDLPAPWRVVLKWRVNNPAGFEGGTRIYVNTIDPWTVAERVRARLA